MNINTSGQWSVGLGRVWLTPLTAFRPSGSAAHDSAETEIVTAGRGVSSRHVPLDQTITTHPLSASSRRADDAIGFFFAKINLHHANCSFWYRIYIRKLLLFCVVFCRFRSLFACCHSGGIMRLLSTAVSATAILPVSLSQTRTVSWVSERVSRV